MRAFLSALVLSFVMGLPAAAAPTNEWVARMDGLAIALTTTLTDAGPRHAPLDDDRKARLRKDADVLRSLVHGLSALHEKPDSDPTIPMLLRELDRAVDDVAHADETRIGDTALAVAWTCMACHTRADVGSAHPIAALAPVDKLLPPDVRGTALAATRRFADARTAFRAGAFDETLAANEPTRWERSVKGALLIDIRVNHDARSALEVANQVLNTPGGDALYEDALAWKQVLAPMAKSKTPWPRTLPALEAEAKKLAAEAEARGPADPAGEILALKATAVVHELLMKSPPKELRAQALAWLGEGYARLRDLDIWSLHLVYDAACVEQAPHSDLARKCYARWRDGARVAFTGNGGGDLPVDLAKRNETLKALAAAVTTP